MYVNEPSSDVRGEWRPWAGAPENYDLSIAALVAIGTMSADIAGTLSIKFQARAKMRS